MVFLMLLNAALLLLPVGTTIGVLRGTDLYRASTGQTSLFGGDTSGSDSGSTSGGSTPSGGGTVISQGVIEYTYCEKSVAISPTSEGTQYTLNPNQWGWTEGTSGSLCLNITTFNNNTYATTESAPDFTVTWQYPVGPTTQPVHAFPNAQIAQDLPLLMSKVKNLTLDLEWSYSVGNQVKKPTNVAALTNSSVNANVAVDMFLDADMTKAENSSLAGYEVMVWFAAFGSATDPIGYSAGSVGARTLDGTIFNLYSGSNSLNQTVLTWLAANTTETFTGDIATLLTTLSTITDVTFPVSTLYLGHMGVGTEAFSSSVNVTFSVPVLAIDVVT